MPVHPMAYWPRLRKVIRPRRLIRRIVHLVVPAKALAYKDLLRPSLRIGCGGPMNGQAGRQQLLRELMCKAQFTRLVETGTYRGTTTEFLYHIAGKPIDTIEASPRFFEYSRRRYFHHPAVSTHLGDSGEYLRLLAASRAPPGTVFFYLDAHWGSYLPLHDELTAIVEFWSDSVVMIDDFCVPDDPGYGYDDYGPGKSLTLDNLPPTCLAGWTLFYPAISSSEETGKRRGCCVISSPSMTPTLRAIDLLRLGGTFRRDGFSDDGMSP